MAVKVCSSRSTAAAKSLKAGLSTTHPLRGDELKAIKAWLATRARMKPETDAFFISERRSLLSYKTMVDYP